ncbi:MAG: hypothetical protein Q8O52_29360 [Sulfuritalea sp.]|nr:hypothetical protein [Sulfuritalea sp.]
MRTCFAFLLAVLFSLNAAYAAVVVVYDTLEHTQGETTHFGNHNHEHGDDHAHDAPPTDPDQPNQLPAASDHHHAHVHPGFSTLLPGAIGIMPLDGRSPLIPVAIIAFASLPQVRLERPPRAVLA